MANPTGEHAQGARPGDCWNYAGTHVPALLDDCSRMLTYATDRGISVAEKDSKNVAIAGEAFARGRWTDKIESDLYTTKSKLAKAIMPVTTETLAPGALQDARKSTRFYFKATLAIASILVPLSMVVFANAKLTSNTKALIEQNDQMAVTLYNELEDHRDKIVQETNELTKAPDTSPSPVSSASGARAPRVRKDAGAGGATAMNVGATTTTTTKTCSASKTSLKNTAVEPTVDVDEKLADTPPALLIKGQLQEFARNNRSLYAQTRWLSRLNWASFQNVYASPWMVNAGTLRENLELRLPILIKPYRSTKCDACSDADAQKPEHAIDDGLQKLAVYQDIRAMAQDAQRTSDIMWAAITTYILPVLYAVLGSLAFILRDLSEQSINKTYHPTHGRFINRVRLVVAIIIGTVIGLFDIFWKDSAVSAQPLAIAFIAGYAANTFFAFLDKSAMLGKSGGKQA
jgi:hypothetical protein